ncbi:hypothetical protein ACG83_21705 [Frankia sp. R43]|uniref:hypothetical protein n=1 Tax=Frankia sp. R43 TaxID=269536 RepID=UPI0006CA27D6|nr:hypothetical protein [Frankia sp. R43]KPM53351.1 hypothetical protein ACG83_21705 [Frankia sp. R43]
MRLRDAIEQALRAWDAHETARGAAPVIDFDCAPTEEPVTAAPSRLDVYDALSGLHERAETENDHVCAEQVCAHLAYLGALLGEKLPLDDYLIATQGCPAGGWPDEYITAVGDRARTALADLGISWGPDTDRQLRDAEGPVDTADAPGLIRAAADELEPAVRALAETDAPYTLDITTADVDAYWAYWLDGTGHNVRLRFNLRNAAFTKTRLRQFALHEILGHALQSASYTSTAERTDVPWPRLLSVHAPYQVLLEGIAQAMPLFVIPDDTAVTARVRLDHYLQLVRAELNQAINTGHSPAACAEHARARVPFWTPGTIADILTDRGNDPQLRSYLWAYPAGIDWFVNLADTADTDTVGKVFRATYTQPLTPSQLTGLWPTGPRIGGPGTPLRLRKPPLP